MACTKLGRVCCCGPSWQVTIDVRTADGGIIEKVSAEIRVQSDKPCLGAHSTCTEVHLSVHLGSDGKVEISAYSS